jgi:hypothetical protein
VGRTGATGHLRDRTPSGSRAQRGALGRPVRRVPDRRAGAARRPRRPDPARLVNRPQPVRAATRPPTGSPPSTCSVPG